MMSVVLPDNPSLSARNELGRLLFCRSRNNMERLGHVPWLAGIENTFVVQLRGLKKRGRRGF